MKKTIFAAFVIVVIIVAAILIIPNIGGMRHKDITREVSQENFIDYETQYRKYASDNGLEFKAAAAAEAPGGYAQTYNLSNDKGKLAVTVGNYGGYEIVEVSYACHHEKDGKLKSIDGSVIDEMLGAYGLIGAAEISKEDVSAAVEDAEEQEGYLLYGYERVEKCGDHPTTITYTADSTQDERIVLSGITKKCKG